MTRRALVVGCNYPGTPYELTGCVNDARQWRDVLVAKKFAVHELTDEHATRARILAALGGLVEQSAPGDCVAFVYSGHGTYVRDADGDEGDGYDEAICPNDFATAGLITDDTLRGILARLPERVGCTVITDCCHSGTVTRFAGGNVRPSLRGTPRYLSPVRVSEAINGRVLAAVRMVPPTPRPALVPPEAMRWVQVAACLPTEVAYESDGRGHFTAAATAILAARPRLTLGGVLRDVLAAWGEDRAQTPMIDGPAGAARRTLVTVPKATP